MDFSIHDVRMVDGETCKVYIVGNTKQIDRKSLHPNGRLTKMGIYNRVERW